METKDLAFYIVYLAREKKAQKIIVLDLRKVIDFCDFFVIASATSTRHIETVSNFIAQGLEKNKKITPFYKPNHSLVHSGWVILDYQSIIVHIFEKVKREFYNLEYLWQEAKRLRIPRNLTPQ